MAKKLDNLFQNPRTLVRNVLMLDDSAHSIALGTAIGVFIGLTPTVGVQMIIVLLTAAACRPFFQFNKLAGVMAVYVSNPLTLVPIYYFEYWIGTRFLEGSVTRAEFAEILSYRGWEGWWHTVCALFFEVGWPLLIGTAIVSTVGGIAAYPATRLLLRWYRSEPRSGTSPNVLVAHGAVSPEVHDRADTPVRDDAKSAARRLHHSSGVT